MDPEGPFFFGKQPLLVDFVVAPWVVSTSFVPRNYPADSDADATVDLRSL